MATADELGQDFKAAIGDLSDVLKLLMPCIDGFVRLREEFISRRAAGDLPDTGDGTMFVLLNMQHHRRCVEAGKEPATDWRPQTEWGKRHLEGVWLAKTIEELVELGLEHAEVCRDVLANGVSHVQVEPFKAICHGLQRVRQMVEPRAIGLERDGMVAEEVGSWPADTEAVLNRLRDAEPALRSTREWPDPVPINKRGHEHVYPEIHELFMVIGDCFFASEELGRTMDECRRIVDLVDRSGEISRTYMIPSIRRSRVAEMIAEVRVRLVWEKFDAYHRALAAFSRSRQRVRDCCARARSELERSERTSGINADLMLKHLGSVGRMLPSHMQVGNVPPLDEQTTVQLEAWAGELDRIGEELRHVAFAVSLQEKTPIPPVFNEDDATNPDACFKRHGGLWKIQFQGESGVWPDSVAMWHLAQLLDRPHPVRPLEALEMMNRDPAAFDHPHSHQPGTDAVAASNLRQVLADLEEDIADAKARGDVAGQERAQANREDFLKRCAEQHSSSRSIAGKTAGQKAKDAVRRALHRVYEVFRTGTPPMIRTADHLEGSIHQEGTAFAYRPRGKCPTWDLGKTDV